MSLEVSGIVPHGQAHRIGTAPTSGNRLGAIKIVLDALNIRGPVTLTKTPGVHLNQSIADTLHSIQLLQPNSLQSEAIRTLGFSNSVLTLVTADEDNRRKIKARLGEVAHSVLDPSIVSNLEKVFGAPFDEVMVDDNGALIVLNGTKEIEKSLVEE
ncbi:hypothetical protein EB093_00995 [bacterium]|nr:hypothetical protein [bacterium]